MHLQGRRASGNRGKNHIVVSNAGLKEPLGESNKNGVPREDLLIAQRNLGTYQWNVNEWESVCTHN
jgi:hypothetical protein